jgi:hypothetical protein
MNQKPKKWFKKQKINPLDPQPEDKRGYYNLPYHFNTKSRDRPTGHTSGLWHSDYSYNTKKRRFFSRHNIKFFTYEGLSEQE